ncbi:hypothetical protein DPMN_113402, partial [Dreissena polymorpha]
SPGLGTVHRLTGALPGRNRHSPGLRLGITGDDRDLTGVLPASGRPGLCRDAVGFHRGSTCVLPATSGALPGLHRVDRDSAGFSVTAFKIFDESSQFSPVDQRKQTGWTGALPEIAVVNQVERYNRELMDAINAMWVPDKIRGMKTYRK